MKLIPIERNAAPSAGGRALAMHEESIRNDYRTTVVETPLLLVKTGCLFLLGSALPIAETFGGAGILIWFALIGLTGISTAKSFAWSAASAISLVFSGRPALPEGTTPELACFENETVKAIEEWNRRATAWNDVYARNSGEETPAMKTARIALEAQREKIDRAAAYLETHRPKCLPSPKSVENGFTYMTAVRHEPTGRSGVVVCDTFGCCAPDEVPVRFLTVTGEYEPGYAGIPFRELSPVP